MTATARNSDEDDQFKLPQDIQQHAAKLTKAGVRIEFTPSELIQMMNHSDDALNGDSNDDEHDALCWLREKLSEAYEDHSRRNKVG